MLTLTAPVDGVVLKRLRESESAVMAGEPLVEIGNPAADLEIVSDLLSTDAVRVQPGARVRVEQWGGDRTLAATVRRVEPSGFTKISALGVEEQRVNVVMDFDDPAEAWKALGDGYRVEVRIVIWEAADVVKVPTSALVRAGRATGRCSSSTAIGFGSVTGRRRPAQQRRGRDSVGTRRRHAGRGAPQRPRGRRRAGGSSRAARQAAPLISGLACSESPTEMRSSIMLARVS